MQEGNKRSRYYNVWLELHIQVFIRTIPAVAYDYFQTHAWEIFKTHFIKEFRDKVGWLMKKQGRDFEEFPFCSKSIHRHELEELKVRNYGEVVRAVKKLAASREFHPLSETNPKGYGIRKILSCYSIDGKEIDNFEGLSPTEIFLKVIFFKKKTDIEFTKIIRSDIFWQGIGRGAS